MNHEAKRLIDSLALVPHPEGGWYRETYRAELSLPRATLPSGYDGPRAAATAILYLLADGDVSVWHRLVGDEVWLHQAGTGIALHLLHPDGRHEARRLGDGPDRDFQIAVPGGCWFGAETIDEMGWSLAACVMAPGYAAVDCEMARGDDLLSQFPDQADLIRRLAR